ncbi:hypothetical protein TcWFU_000925 [Taenia crassiceps]|uniref:PH domain-containing protein n=1 Tax=Taenia crassiceps TaxID=6207 RepID=A0ABR4QB39_9CEST
MNPILEGYVKYRDGKKWKRRYCILCSPSKSLSVLHLYFGKSVDDFNAAFRSPQSSSAFSGAALGPSSSSTTTSNITPTSGSGSKPTVNVFHSLTTRSNYYCNLPHPQSHAIYVADPVTEMCNQAERAVVHDLETAAGRARSLGCPVPLDTVTGFETGCHLSGESNVVLLIGWKTVHPIALPSVDEMFNWAEVLERALIVFEILPKRLDEVRLDVISLTTKGSNAPVFKAFRSGTLESDRGAGPSDVFMTVSEYPLRDPIDCSGVLLKAHALVPLPISWSSSYSHQEMLRINSNYHVTLCRVGNASDNTSASSCILGVGGGGCGGLGGSGVASVPTSSSTTSGIIPTSTVVVGGGGATSSVSSSSSFRLQLGLQASLHVQQWRLCLIGEPSAGCQFIAQWRLDALDAAYTMESGSNSGAFSTFGGPAYDPVGGQTFLGFTPPGAQGVSPTFNTSYQNDDRFFLEANRAAGKGLAGNYVFQVDGRRLGQLARAIDELMLRRFPALTAPPGTRVLPSTNTDDESLHLRKSAAIEIRSSSGAGKPLFGASSSSLSPPTGVGCGGGAGGGGGGVFGSASPHGSGGSFAPSSLPTRGGGGSAVAAPAAAAEEMPMVPQHSSSSASSSRSKKSGHRQLFGGGGVQTLGRSDAIKIPTRRFTTALSKMTGDGGFSSRGRSSSKTGSGEGSAEGSSSDASSTKPQPPLYFPSVMVGAGIITSLVPAPPPPSLSARSEVFGTSAAPPATATASLRSKQKSELPPPPPVAAPPPPPPPPPHLSPPSPPYCLACERCQRRGRRGHQKTPSIDPASISSEDGGGGAGGGGNGGGIFAADEDVEQPMPLSVTECRRLLRSYRGFYNLYKQLCRTVKPFHTNCRLSRSGSFDVCAARRRKLVRERVFEALGGGEGSVLDRLLLSISPPLDDIASCVFLLAFSPPSKPPSVNELEYRWYLVHRPGNCCSRCCLWNTPVLLAELNLQDVVAHQIRILSLKEGQKTSASLRSIPCGAIPCLSTSRLFVWRFAGATPFGEMSQCSSHNKPNLPRPWSVLYLGPDSEIDDGTLPVSPSILSISSPYCCCYCGSPLSRPRRGSRMQQQNQQSHRHQDQQPNHHVYANLIRNIGSSTLPSVYRRNYHHRTAPVVFPEKASASRDVPVDHNRRGVFSTSSTSCSTSQASSPSSPLSHVSYYNLASNVGPACPPPNPLKYSFHEERSSGAYANLQHLYAPLNSQQNRWRMPCGVRASVSAAVVDQIPDEIREPKRNYALVDLRPSPASSVIAPSDTITLVSTSEDAVLTTSDGGASGGGGGGSGSRTDSSASTLHTNTSTSSSAATFVQGNGGNRPRTASQHRRTSSHSLIAVLPVPTLNYVHIMTKRDVEAVAAGVAGCESPASSSTATSSTASSSEKEQRAPAAVPLNLATTTVLESPAEQVPYAQIDFERTRALNAVNGAGEVNHPHGHHFHHSHHHKAATNAFTAPLSGGKPSLVSGCSGLRGLSTRKKSDGW